MTLFLKDEDIRQCVSMDDMLEAIESMQRRYGHGEAYNLARRMLDDWALAEDAVQESLISGFRAFGQFGTQTATRFAVILVWQSKIIHFTGPWLILNSRWNS